MKNFPYSLVDLADGNYDDEDIQEKAEDTLAIIPYFSRISAEKEFGH